MKNLLAAYFVHFLLSACSPMNGNESEAHKTVKQGSQNSKVIVGIIDETFLTELKNRDPKVENIITFSKGGETSVGIKIAHEIANGKLDITIAELCLSACAEYILPAAQNVYLLDEPLIGYHWNPIILGNLLRRNATQDLEYCTRIGDDELVKLLFKVGKKTDAWKQTLKRINLIEYKVDYKENECPWSLKKFENKFWFPTTKQLENIFGVKVSGKLCADDPECYQKKLQHYFKKKGGSFIVGDTKFVVANRTAKE